MIKILTFAMLVGSLSIASANYHEEETITLDNLADALGGILMRHPFWLKKWPMVFMFFLV